MQCNGPNGVSALYVQQPVNDGLWPQGFVEALRMFIEAAYQKGLNEDANAAAMAMKGAKEELADALSRDTQQEREPARFRSKLREARRFTRGGY